MRAVTILICVVVMVAVACAHQQQQQQRTGKQDKNVAHKHHQNVESATSHGKQDIKATKNGKSNKNIKAEWKTETLVVEVSPSQKSHKKASTKAADIPIVEKQQRASGKNNARPSVEKAATFAPKKQNKVDAKKNVVAPQEEEIVEEEQEVVVPKKQRKQVVKPVKPAKTSVTVTKKEKPCPCSAAKMEEVIEEEIDETIDEVLEKPCAAAKAVKKVKTQACRKVVEEEDTTEEETPCSKKAKNNCAGATKKVAKHAKSVSVSTKPIKQCPLDEMIQCAKGWERDALTGECKPSTGCAIKKEKALKKIGIRLPATHSITVKQDENNTEDFTVDIVSNDAKEVGEAQQFTVTESDDTENVTEEDDDDCEMCTQY